MRVMVHDPDWQSLPARRRTCWYVIHLQLLQQSYMQNCPNPGGPGDLRTMWMAQLQPRKGMQKRYPNLKTRQNKHKLPNAMLLLPVTKSTHASPTQLAFVLSVYEDIILQNCLSCTSFLLHYSVKLCSIQTSLLPLYPRTQLTQSLPSSIFRCFRQVCNNQFCASVFLKK